MHRLLSLAAIAMCLARTQAQDVTTPPSAQHALLTVEGRGVQIYSCMKTEKTTEWVFVAPAARLFDKDGIEVGTHGDGPVWHLEDGSSVLGKVVGRSASPDAQAIPWLLVKAVTASATGKLARVEFIRRSETKGGSNPAGGCDGSHLGDSVRVPYTAAYTFYSAQ